MKALSMTKLFFAFVTFVSLLTTVHAGELERAYQKEYAFLKAQKAELEKRLETDKVHQANETQASKEKAEALQGKLLDVSAKVKSSSEKLEKLSKMLAEKEETGGLTGNVVNQARLALEPYGMKVSDDNKTNDVEKIQQAFGTSIKLYSELSSLRN